MSPDAVAPWLLAVKIALYSGGLIAIGLALHAAQGILEAPARKFALVTAAMATATALLSGFVRFALTSAQLGAPFDPNNAGLVWQTQGAALLTLALALALTGAALLFRSRVAAGLGAIALAASFALTGHAQGVSNPLLTPLAVTVHVACAGFWLAAPATLWPGQNASDDILIARVKNFSTWAAALIPLLFILGGWLALRLAGGLDSLIASLYGQLLLAKLAVATGALALGGYNKLVVTKALELHPHRGRSMLRVALLVDLAFFATALIIVGWATTMTGPPGE